MDGNCGHLQSKAFSVLLLVLYHPQHYIEAATLKYRFKWDCQDPGQTLLYHNKDIFGSPARRWHTVGMSLIIYIIIICDFKW